MALGLRVRVDGVDATCTVQQCSLYAARICKVPAAGACRPASGRTKLFFGQGYEVVSRTKLFLVFSRSCFATTRAPTCATRCSSSPRRLRGDRQEVLRDHPAEEKYLAKRARAGLSTSVSTSLLLVSTSRSMVDSPKYTLACPGTHHLNSAMIGRDLMPRRRAHAAGPILTVLCRGRDVCARSGRRAHRSAPPG